MTVATKLDVNEVIKLVDPAGTTDTIAWEGATAELKAKFENRIHDDLRSIIIAFNNRDVNTFIDDHVSYKREEVKFDGIAVIDNGYVCPLLAGKIFSLNNLYVEKETGDIRLSRSSVAGVVHDTHNDMENAIEKHNETCIRKVVAFAMFE